MEVGAKWVLAAAVAESLLFPRVALNFVHRLHLYSFPQPAGAL